jgi:hypothetical protein
VKTALPHPALDLAGIIYPPGGVLFDCSRWARGRSYVGEAGSVKSHRCEDLPGMLRAARIAQYQYTDLFGENQLENSSIRRVSSK